MKILKMEKHTESMGTSRRGVVKTTFSRLVSAFGPPYLYTQDCKVHAEWTLSFLVFDTMMREIVLTIYDWKTNELPMEEYDWHIGGFPAQAPYQIMLVEQCLQEDDNDLE